MKSPKNVTVYTGFSASFPCENDETFDLVPLWAINGRAYTRNAIHYSKYYLFNNRLTVKNINSTDNNSTIQCFFVFADGTVNSSDTAWLQVLPGGKISLAS